MENLKETIFELSYNFHFTNYLEVLHSLKDTEDSEFLDLVVKLGEENITKKGAYSFTSLESIQLINFLNNLSDFTERLNFFLFFSTRSKGITLSFYDTLMEVYNHYVRMYRFDYSVFEPFLNILLEVKEQTKSSDFQTLLLLKDNQFKNIDQYISLLYFKEPNIPLSEIVKRELLGHVDNEKIITVFNTASRTIGLSSVLYNNIKNLTEKLDSINAYFAVVMMPTTYITSLGIYEKNKAFYTGYLYKTSERTQIVENINKYLYLTESLSVVIGSLRVTNRYFPLTVDKYHLLSYYDKEKPTFYEFTYFYLYLFTLKDEKYFINNTEYTHVFEEHKKFSEENTKVISGEQFLENIKTNNRLNLIN